MKRHSYRFLTLTNCQSSLTPNTGFNSGADANNGVIMTAMAELQKRGVDPALTRIISVVAAPQLYKK